MARFHYILAFAFAYAVSVGIMFWLAAPYLATGLPYLPERGIMQCSLGVTVMIIAGLWWRMKEPPHRGQSALNKWVGRILQVSAAAMISVTTARLLLPHLMPVLLDKPHGLAYMMWYGVFTCGVVLFRSVPLYCDGDLASILLSTVVAKADAVLAKDPRKPVIYLRSFAAEHARSRPRGRFLPYLYALRSPQCLYLFSSPGNTMYGGRAFRRNLLGSNRSMYDEQMIFAHAFEAIGPYVAIGRPTEIFRNMDLGAAKVYLTDEEWRGVVLRWLCDAAAVVVDAGDSGGLAWEVEQVMRVVPATRVLIICPYSEMEYHAFVRRFAELFPVPLPEKRPPSRLLMFAQGWQPQELENINLCAIDTLEPFVQQVRAS